MIVITAHGRLGHQPELKMLPGGGSVCEFRLLSSRFAKGEEVTEAVTFFCFDEEAEKFCESTEKGQLISATGTQETSSYNDAQGARKSFTKYRMTWYSKGARTTLVVNAQAATDRVVGIKPTETKATSAPQTAATAERPVRRAINLSSARNGPPRRLHRLKLTTVTVASIRTLTGSMT